jgi:hypothetical protein
LLKPEWVIGVGGFAKKRIDKVRGHFFNEVKHDANDSFSKPVFKFSTGQILHPSPANPKANVGWDREVVKTLKELGVWL